MESARKKLKISDGNEDQSINALQDNSGSSDLDALAKSFLEIEDKQCDALLQLDYGQNICYIYNPLEYAREIHKDFLAKFCKGPKKVLLLGMNPGPWGMGQTGVPFGHVQYTKEWLCLKGNVTKPKKEHPKRLITGLECTRSEVSGDRLWSLLKELSGKPETLFTNVFLHNYCPLFFLKDSAKNVTPPELKVKERSGLEKICDVALVDTVKLLEVERLVCVGNYVAEKSKLALGRAGLENIKFQLVVWSSDAQTAHIALLRHLLYVCPYLEHCVHCNGLGTKGRTSLFCPRIFILNDQYFNASKSCQPCCK